MRVREKIAGRGLVRGVSLLEAIVAMAILGGAALALFAWLNQSLHTASRLRQVDLESRLMLNAQALVETINPMDKSQGEQRAGGLRVRWTSTPLEAPRPNATFFPPNPGPWQVGLYRLQVEAEEAGVQVSFEQWRVGLKRLVQVEASL